jgi:hypothetical protein
VITLLGFVLRVLVLYLLARLLFRALARRRGERRRFDEAARAGRLTELVRDRVCDTYLPRSSAITASIGGREEHFCSVSCAERARRG